MEIVIALTGILAMGILTYLCITLLKGGDER